MLISVEQMFVNEALVKKILECERDEGVLRAAAQKLNELLAYHSGHQAQERHSIARQLQDSLDHGLIALRTDLLGLLGRGEVAPAAAVALDRLERTIASLEHLIADLRPLQLELGFAAAVEWEVDQFRRAYGRPCELALDPQLSGLVLPDETLAVLYRALQECLNNVKRHAQARHISVTAQLADEAICITVVDDGIGFDVHRPAHPHARGLRGIRQGIQALGGELTVDSSQARGSTVALSVPVVAVHAYKT